MNLRFLGRREFLEFELLHRGGRLKAFRCSTSMIDECFYGEDYGVWEEEMEVNIKETRKEVIFLKDHYQVVKLNH